MPQKNTIKNLITAFSDHIDVIDIELIIAHVLKKSRVFVITHNDNIIPQNETDIINKFCKKRATGYPLAYITGHKEFFGRDFYVSEDTLIPRTETEILINAVIDQIKTSQLEDSLVCDIGTGTGIIPITLKKELSKISPALKIVASDISQKALLIAQKNVTYHTISDIDLYNSDLLSKDLFSLCKNTSAQNIIITANLPYVDMQKKNMLFSQKNSHALQHEPEVALWSEDAGTAHYKRLIQQTLHIKKEILNKKNVYSFYEIDPDQSHSLQKHINARDPYGTTSCAKDLAQKDRVILWVTQT